MHGDLKQIIVRHAFQYAIMKTNGRSEIELERLLDDFDIDLATYRPDANHDALYERALVAVRNIAEYFEHVLFSIPVQDYHFVEYREGSGGLILEYTKAF